jgi:hypothetical protein
VSVGTRAEGREMRGDVWGYICERVCETYGTGLAFLGSVSLLSLLFDGWMDGCI